MVYGQQELGARIQEPGEQARNRPRARARNLGVARFLTMKFGPSLEIGMNA
jgi:hypothetical protein